MKPELLSATPQATLTHLSKDQQYNSQVHVYFLIETYQTKKNRDGIAILLPQHKHWNNS